MDLEDLHGLKRPALQKLCKKFGIRANGKNSEMIASLEDIRNINADSLETASLMMEMDTCATTEDEKQTVEPLTTAATATVDVPSPTGDAGDRKKGRSRINSSPASICEASSCAIPEEDKMAVTGDSSRSTRKRRRNSSWSAEVSTPSDLKRLKLAQPMSAAEETSQASPKEILGHDTFEDIRQPSSPVFGSSSSDPTLPCHVKKESSGAVEETNGVEAVASDENVEDDRPVPEPPISPPSDTTRRSSLGKRQRNLTYSKDEEEPVNSPSNHKQRRSTYEVHPSDSFLAEETKVSCPVVGPCDSTIGGERRGVAKCAGENDAMEIDPAASQGDQDEDGSAAKDDIMKLLEKRVLDRKADPSYVSAYDGSDHCTPSKTEVESKFDKAHKSTFSKMKSISTCYEENLARQKSLGVTPRGSIKTERRVSLTSKARAKMNCVTPSMPLKKTASGSVKKPWESANKTSARTFKPSVSNSSNASYNFSTDETVKFEGNMKIKSSSTACIGKTTGNKKTLVKSSVALKLKAKENNPAHSVTKKKSNFDLQASLKKSLNYKPYTGKVPHIHKK